MLNSSGQISICGATAGESIAKEIERGSPNYTPQLGLGDPEVVMLSHPWGGDVDNPSFISIDGLRGVVNNDVCIFRFYRRALQVQNYYYVLPVTGTATDVGTDAYKNPGVGFVGMWTIGTSNYAGFVAQLGTSGSTAGKVTRCKIDAWANPTSYSQLSRFNGMPHVAECGPYRVSVPYYYNSNLTVAGDATYNTNQAAIIVTKIEKSSAGGDAGTLKIWSRRLMSVVERTNDISNKGSRAFSAVFANYWSSVAIGSAILADPTCDYPAYYFAGLDSNYLTIYDGKLRISGNAISYVTQGGALTYPSVYPKAFLAPTRIVASIEYSNTNLGSYDRPTIAFKNNTLLNPNFVLCYTNTYRNSQSNPPATLINLNGNINPSDTIIDVATYNVYNIYMIKCVNYEAGQNAFNATHTLYKFEVPNTSSSYATQPILSWTYKEASYRAKIAMSSGRYAFIATEYGSGPAKVAIMKVDLLNSAVIWTKKISSSVTGGIELRDVYIARNDTPGGSSGAWVYVTVKNHSDNAETAVIKIPVSGNLTGKDLTENLQEWSETRSQTYTITDNTSELQLFTAGSLLGSAVITMSDNTTIAPLNGRFSLNNLTWGYHQDQNVVQNVVDRYFDWQYKPGLVGYEGGLYGLFQSAYGMNTTAYPMNQSTFTGSLDTNIPLTVTVLK